jgi:hypothetical protein
MGQLTHTTRTDNTPDPDGTLKTVTRSKFDITDSCILIAQTR